MPAGLIVAICAAPILPLHRLLEQTLPSRYGKLQARMEWLTIGTSSLLAFSLLGLLFPDDPALALSRAFAFVLGIWAVAFLPIAASVSGRGVSASIALAFHGVPAGLPA